MDTLLGLDRSFLSSVQDVAQIRYQYKPKAVEVAEDPEETYVPPVSNPVTDRMEHVQAPAPAAAVAASSIADVPMPALQIILCLVAFKLRKAMDTISSRKSLKDLSSGKRYNMHSPTVA